MTEYKTISVIISTYNRLELLKECLRCYQKQTLPTDAFELLIVDDGSAESIADKIKVEDYAFKIKLLRQDHAGPAKARNWAIQEASCDIVLFSGDDILPAEDFLEKHVKAHLRYQDANIAVLGYISWSPDVPINSLMYYVTEVGGQQFEFFQLTDQTFVDHHRFYTSNISLKRDYLQKTGESFSTRFTTYGFEDIELGHRLGKQHGLRIFFDKTINAYHKHGMSLKSFYKRQFNVGQMAVVFDRLHPEFFVREKPWIRSAIFPTHEVIPEEFLRYFRDIKLSQQAPGLSPQIRSLLKRVEHNFFSEVFVFAFRSGASFYNKKNPHEFQ